MAMLDDKTIAAITGPEPGKTVLRIKEPDVEGLWLRVTKRTDKEHVERVSKSWEFYWTKPDGMLGCIGLGRWVEPPAPGKRQPRNTRTARQARIEADRLAEGLDRGEQPVGQRQAKAELRAAKAEAERAKKIEDARAKTFASAVEDYLEKKDAELDSVRHRQIWRSSFVRYAVPIIGDMAVSEITREDILRVLDQPLRDLKSDKPIAGTSLWSDRTETASRLRNRIQAVLSASTVAGYRSGSNPADWKGNLEHILLSPTKLTKNKKENQPALAVSDLPTWFAELRKREGMGAKALGRRPINYRPPVCRIFVLARRNPAGISGYFKGLQHRQGGNPANPKGADIASSQGLAPLVNRTTIDGAVQTPDISRYSRWRPVVYRSTP